MVKWYLCLETAGDGYSIPRHPICIPSKTVGFQDLEGIPRNTMVLGDFSWTCVEGNDCWLVRVEEHELNEYVNEITSPAEWKTLYNDHPELRGKFVDQPTGE